MFIQIYKLVRYNSGYKLKIRATEGKVLKIYLKLLIPSRLYYSLKLLEIIFFHNIVKQIFSFMLKSEA